MKIVVDTNIVFSGILNSSGKIGKILINSRPIFSSIHGNYLREEIMKHRLRLLSITKLTEIELGEPESLVTQHIIFINEALLPHELIRSTEALLKNIDPNDTPFVALAKHLEARLLTGDMQLYRGLKAKRFKGILTTAELSMILDDLENE